MPVRGTGEDALANRFALGFRAIDGIPVDRARSRFTLTYEVTQAFRAGIEWNPLDDDLGVLANWRVLDETDTRPAVILGTSSARIGSTHGRALYATASKDLEPALDLPLSSYVGLSYDGFDDEVNPVAGVSVRWHERVSTTHMYDGENVHHLGTVQVLDRLTAGLLVAEVEDEHYVGFAVGARFGLGFLERE